ncbi:hypothetical protein [Spiroplasma endosymbiont of Polydrusus cervinus]|uniref:hypothetical protein n=1 Tax=Spiroplasma endosymbiont of Polydrusus cervinus TaxID=3066287 RepID=UPI0030D2B05A
MKKLLSLLSILTISGTGVPIMIADIPYQKNTIKDLSELNWTGLNINKNKRDTKNNQTKHIFKTNGADRPTEKQIKNKVKELNPQLNINNINVTKITENSAVITVTGFSNQKTINFTVDKSMPLNKIIIKTDLGQLKYKLKDENISVLEIEIITKLKKLNPQIDIYKVNIKDITNNGVTIFSSDPIVYTGEVNITFKIFEFIRLNKIITQTNLGEFITNNLSNPSEQQIKDKLKEIYSDLDITKIKVENITNSSAIITSADKTVYTKNVNVNYTVSAESLNW